MSENDGYSDPEFTGDKLHDLVIAIELAIGARKAGCTPLGIAVTNLCEDAIKREENLKNLVLK